MKNRFLLIAFAILTMGIFVTSNVLADDVPDSEPAPPQPQSAVARISVIHGNVSTMRGDGGQWVAATVNTPLVPGDQVATGDQSRTEVQLDYANIMRLEQHTDAKVADLEQKKIQIQLASGLINYTVFQGTQADAEIDTPNMGVHPLSPGVYHIEVDSPGETRLIVRQGEAEVLTNQGSTKVQAGQIIQVRGTDNPEYKIDSAPGGDEFDKWCANRDRQIQTAQAWQHTSPEYTGAGDLDTYGQWEQVPDYGWCWTPEVDAGWVPYSAGSWGWEPYWGWTWISYEPWGWAPYHYGRWFMYGGRWAWWPAVGFFGPHPIWAPAYVSFFGFGGGFGIGFGFGSIGWLALGPRDIFHPWFGAGHRFSALGFNDIHGAGFIRPGGPAFGSNLASAMTDARIRNAIRNVSASDFGSGRMGRSTPVSESMLHSASMMRGSPPVARSFSNRSYGAGSFSGSHMPSANGQHFFSRSGSTSMAGGRGTASTGGNWQRYSSGNTAGRWPAAVNGPSTGFQGRSAPSTEGNQHNWQRYASPNPYSGRQSYSSPSRGYSGGNNYGGGSRSPLELNRPIMRQRAPSGGYYGGNRSYSGGNRSNSAPKGESGHSYSAPRGGGGGGGHSSGGGHAGGGHGGGHR